MSPQETDQKKFEHYIQQQLQIEESSCLLIGEEHTTLPALNRLAQCQDFFSQSPKQTVLFCEKLHRLLRTGLFCCFGKQDYPYTIEDIQDIELDEDDKNDFISLINSGITIYGLEDADTNTFKLLNDCETEEECYRLVESKFAYLFKDQNDLTNFKARNYDVNEIKHVLSYRFAHSDDRLVIPNRKFSSLIATLSKLYPSSLCIVIVGNAHVPSARLKTDHSIFEKGIAERLSFAGLQVTACTSLSLEEDYTPPEEPHLTYDVIPKLPETGLEYTPNKNTGPS